MIYFTTNVCKNLIVDTLGCKKRKKHLSFRIRKKKGQTVVILFFTGLSKIWQRIWREDKSKHRLSFLCTCKTQRHYAERQMGCRHSCLLCLLWIRSVTVNDDFAVKTQAGAGHQTQAECKITSQCSYNRAHLQAIWSILMAVSR